MYGCVYVYMYVYVCMYMYTVGAVTSELTLCGINKVYYDDYLIFSYSPSISLAQTELFNM